MVRRGSLEDGGGLVNGDAGLPGDRRTIQALCSSPLAFFDLRLRTAIFSPPHPSVTDDVTLFIVPKDDAAVKLLDESLPCRVNLFLRIYFVLCVFRDVADLH